MCRQTKKKVAQMTDDLSNNNPLINACDAHNVCHTSSPEIR